MTDPTGRPAHPPEPPQQPFEHTAFGVTRPDPFHWMRDRGSAALLAHLRAERGWYDAATAHLGSLVDALAAEMVGRLPAPDRSVRWRLPDRWYYRSRPAGSEFGQLLRELNHPAREDVRIPPVAVPYGDGIRHPTWAGPAGFETPPLPLRLLNQRRIGG